jgi:insertion element IS1 protein InsB
VEERNRCIVIYFGPVDECHRQATRCFDPLNFELDPRSCRDARAAPSTGSGRERGRHGTGRTLAFPSKKKNKLWIWLAFDRSGQRLIDWQCGNRDAATLNRLLERLKPWSVTLYCTDDYAPYDTLLPVGRHYIGKDETVAIERVNSRLRHWFARFRRRMLRDNQNHARCDNQASLPAVSVVERKLHPGIMMSGRQASVKPGPLGPRRWRLRA